MNRARIVVIGLVAVLVSASCGQDVRDRPTGRFAGTFLPPPAGGGGGGDEDAGTPGDGGVPVGRTVEGRVVAIEDLGETPDRASGVPERQVGGFDGTGTLVTTVSGADGAFLLESLAAVDPIVLSVSGAPPSYVVFPATDAAGAIAPVVDADFLQEVATTQAVTLGGASGHAFSWFLGASGEPLAGLEVEVASASPVLGPYYGIGDRTQIAGAGPTGPEGLVVLLNAVPGDLVLHVYRAEDPAMRTSVTVPIAEGVVTFVQTEIDL